MSSKQHDYVIDNASGSVVRGDINDVLQAIVSLNYGDNQPTTRYPYQWWADTQNNILKIRNSANDDWINVITLAGGVDVDAASNFNEDVTFTSANGNNIVFDKSANSLTIGDSVTLKIGGGGDLVLQHTGSKSTINDAGTGDLEIQRGGTAVLSIVSGGVSLAGGAAANVTALSDGSTITIDMATACHHSVTLGGNRTFAAPSNQVVGQSGSIFITQDGTGSRTATFNSAFKFIGGTAPTLTTTASATDRIDYIIKSSNVIHCAVSLDVK
tara:strand:- start:219 stop:1028 length:810 start_codon:yes stop_codon:yes gene_type:complete